EADRRKARADADVARLPAPQRQRRLLGRREEAQRDPADADARAAARAPRRDRLGSRRRRAEGRRERHQQPEEPGSFHGARHALRAAPRARRPRSRARPRERTHREVRRPRARPRARRARLRLGAGGGGGIVSASVLHRRFDRARELAPGPFDARREALEAFLAAGFPTRRDEAWRYTDLKPIAEGDFDVPPRETSAAARERVRALLADVASADLGDAAARIVVVDGRLDDALSRLDGPAGLEITRIPPEQPAGAHRAASAHPLA